MPQAKILHKLKIRLFGMLSSLCARSRQTLTSRGESSLPTYYTVFQQRMFAESSGIELGSFFISSPLCAHILCVTSISNNSNLGPTAQQYTSTGTTYAVRTHRTFNTWSTSSRIIPSATRPCLQCSQQYEPMRQPLDLASVVIANRRRGRAVVDCAKGHGQLSLLILLHEIGGWHFAAYNRSIIG